MDDIRTDVAKVECSFQGIAVLSSLAWISHELLAPPDRVEILCPVKVGRRDPVYQASGTFAVRKDGVWSFEGTDAERIKEALWNASQGNEPYDYPKFELVRSFALAAMMPVPPSPDRIAGLGRMLHPLPDNLFSPSCKEGVRSGWSRRDDANVRFMRALVRGMPRHAAHAVVCHAESNGYDSVRNCLGDGALNPRSNWRLQWVKALAAEGFDLAAAPVPGMQTAFEAQLRSPRSPDGMGSGERFEVLKELVSAGADVNRMVGDRYPIQWDLNHVQEFIDLGADVNVRYPDGDTMLHRVPLLFFHRWSEEGMLAVTLALTEAGADLEALDAKGRTRRTCCRKSRRP